MRKWFCRVGVAVLLAEQVAMAHDVPVPHIHVGNRGAVIDVLLVIAGLVVGIGGVWLLRRRRGNARVH